jgi:hypothetical protein
MNGVNGPTPGSILVGLAPTAIPLTQIQVLGGWCRLMNYDTRNFVEVGVLDPVTHGFYPLLELLPGETYAVRLSRKLGVEYGTGAGTGTDVVGTGKQLAAKAFNAPVILLVEAFDA